MKKVQRIAMIISLLFLLNVIFAYAALIDPVTSKLKYIFFNLSGTAAFAVWLKFAFFVIIFAVLYGAGSRVHALGEGPMRRALAVISFVIALTSAIFVPYTLLLYIFKMYHALLVVLFGILPALVGYLVASRIPIETDAHAPSRWGRVIRGFIYLLITVFIFGLIGQIKATSSPETELYMAILEPLMWGAIIAFVLGIFNLIMAMGGDTVASHVPQWLGGTGGAAPPGPTPTAPTTPSTTQVAPTPPGPQTTPAVLPVPLPPIKPKPTPLPPWKRGPNPKYDPNPPKDPKFPIPRQIPPPAPPTPSKIIEPVNIDLSPAFLPVKNQGNSGACAAFAAVSIIEYLLNLRAQAVALENDLSEVFLWYLFRREKDRNEGTYMHDIPQLGPKSCTEPLWSWLPINASGLPIKFRDPPAAEAHNDANTKKVASVRGISIDPDDWVAELQKGNPILIGVWVDTAFAGIRSRTSYLYAEASGIPLGGHAMVIVGFSNQFPDPKDPTKSIAAFKVRNSWGSNWGENGYVWIERNFFPTIFIAIPLIFEGIKSGISDEGPAQPESLPFNPNKIKIFLDNMQTIVQTLEKIIALDIKMEKEIDALIIKFCEQTDKKNAVEILHEIEKKISIEHTIGRKEYIVLKKMLPLEKSLEKLYLSLFSLSKYIEMKIKRYDTTDEYYNIAVALHNLKERLLAIRTNEGQKIAIIAEALKKLEAWEITTKEMIEIMKAGVETDGITHVCSSLKEAISVLKEKHLIPTLQAVQSIKEDLKALQRGALEIIVILEKIK